MKANDYNPISLSYADSHPIETIILHLHKFWEENDYVQQHYILKLICNTSAKF